MKNSALALVATCVLAASLAGCGNARSTTEAAAGAEATCAACHGGADNQTGAPPKDLKGNTATTEITVGAHSAHVTAGPFAAAIDCGECHPKPAQINVPTHMDGTVQIAWGRVATAGGATPAWDRATATCSNVYCHGSTLGSPNYVAPKWTKVDGTQAACGGCHTLPPANHAVLAPGFTASTCNVCHPGTVKPDGTIDVAGGKHVNGQVEALGAHPLGWLDPQDPAFHGTAAHADSTGCQKCHALTAPGTVLAMTCSSCHQGAANGDWTVNCASCHGSANPAPPRDLAGHLTTSFVGVGAHQSHVRGTHGFSAPLDCTSCHPKPDAVESFGHMDGTVQVTGYTGSDPDLLAAVRPPGWDRSTASCSASYCHGAASTLGGGGVSSPVWTVVDGSQVYCGSCHGLPPTGHTPLAPGSNAVTCNACHPETVRPDGTIDVTSGAHMNGRADGFAGHPGDWMVKGRAQFHGQAVVEQGVDTCFRCHSAKAPAKGSVITCALCHDNLAGGDWTQSCKGCHGSTANLAPPQDAHGNTATSAVGVGAHQSHVTGVHGLMAPLDCVFCHQVPATVFAPGHMNGTPDLSGYTGTDPTWKAVLTTQGWNDAAATCTNYCHGATLGGGTASPPVWTRVDGSQRACGACHGLPPPGHPALAAGSTLATCSLCHPSTVRPDGLIDAAGGKHINGVVDGFTGHPADWMNGASPGFHGKVATPDDPACFVCHAKQPPAYGAAFTCSDCHTQLSSGSWATSCNGCHGSTSNFAPPRDVTGHTATTAIGVGAHQSHVTGTHGVAAPLDCTSCHPKPATALVAPHMDGKVDVGGYTGTDPALLAAVKDPGWNPVTASCATSYCHGATLGGGTASQPVWTRVDGSQAACGSCHGLPPAQHMTLTPPVTAATCNACHPDTVKPDGTIDVAKGMHVNGTVETAGFAGHGAGWLVPGDPGFHGTAATTGGVDACFHCHSPTEPSTNGIRTCASCHDALAGGVDWTTSCLGCHGDTSTAAPPKDVHGNTATTAIGVGAHRSHVEATHGLAQRFDCNACHQKPATVFATGHLDGATLVTGYTGADARLQSVKDPTWSPSTATCSTSWCHGGYSGVFTYWKDDGSGTLYPIDYPYTGRQATPTWTVVDGTQGACGTCHGIPPQPSGQWHSSTHGGTLTACSLCHPGVNADGSGFLDASSHVNGVVDVTPRFTSRCFGCH